MGNQVKFIVYSDIHYDRLGARCVTIEDCEEVERAVHNRMNAGFDFSIFCGDRFLKREPEDEVKTRADKVLRTMLKSRNPRPHFHLVGNHDWVTNSKRWHTSKSLDWEGETPIVLGSPSTFEYRAGVVKVNIHYLPAGFEMDMSVYKVDSDALNLFIFHDMVMGCMLDDQGKVLAESGIQLKEIDRPEFDLVLGGDVHIPQRLPFKNTMGGYVGAVLQRTRADANCERGWMEVVATRTDGSWDFDIDFVPVRGFFTKFSYEVTEGTTYESIVLDGDVIVDTCCDVELIGSRADVDRIANDPRWKNYEEYYNVRSLNVVRKYKVEQQEAVVDMSESVGVLDDLKIYLDSGFVDTGNITSSRINEMINLVTEGN